jgi:hypothetical protein
MPREGYVYRIIAPGSNSVYVGQSVEPLKRFIQHKSNARGTVPANPALSNFLRKHPDAEIYFWPAIDMDAEEVADEQLCRDMGLNLLNCAPCGGVPPSAKGRRASPETRARMKETHIGFKGHKHTDETRKRMSIAKKGRPLSPEQCAKRVGRTHTAETKAKMSAARNKGRRAE